MVLGGGLEPPRLAAHAPQACVYAIPPPEQGEQKCVQNLTGSGDKRQDASALPFSAPCTENLMRHCENRGGGAEINQYAEDVHK